MKIPKMSVVLDTFKRHRLQIAVWLLVVGIVLTGTPIPLPHVADGINLPPTIKAPIFFPALVPFGKVAVLLGLIGGGFAILTKWLKLTPDDSQKMAKALADATRTGKAQYVETRADRPNVLIEPVEPTPKA